MYISIITLFLVTTALALDLPNGCPADFNIHRLLPHETNCDKFYQCSNGDRILKTCSSGTLFDVELQICNWADAVPCHKTPEYLPNGCPSDIHVHILLPHETDCQKFYQCSNGQKILKTCGARTRFDTELQVCNWADVVKCRSNTVTTTKAPTTEETTTVEPTTEETTTVEPTTVKPTTEETTTVEPTTVKPTTVKPTTVEPTTQETTTEEPTTNNPTTGEPTTEKTTTLAPPICLPGEFGNVPHPEKCGSFYMCQGGIAILLDCIRGYEFDPVSKNCIPIAEGGCTLNTVEPTTPPELTTEDPTTKEPTTQNPTTVKQTTEDATTVEPTTEDSTTVKLTTPEQATEEPTTKNPTIEDSTTQETTTMEPTTVEPTTVELTTIEPTTEKTTSVKPTTGEPTTEKTTTLAPPICLPGEFGNVKHPDKCNSFYMCQGGLAILLDCIRGYEFDPVSRNCVPIAEGGCTLGSQTTTENIETSETTTVDPATIEPTTVEPTTEDTTTVEQTTKVATTVEPTTEDTTTVEQTTKVATTVEPTTEESTTVELTRPEQTTEEPTTNNPTTEESTTQETTTVEPTTVKPTTVEPTTVEPTTEKTTTLAPPICLPGEFGNVPHPDKCNSFYICQGGIAILLDCIRGYEFDPASKNCIPIAEGGCTLESQTSTDNIEITTTLEPTIEESTAVEPTTVKPTTVEPTTVEPTTVEPTTVEPTTVEPTTVKPTTVEPTTVEPTTVKPTTVKPTTVEPTTVKPTTREPTTVKPTTVEPTTVKPTTREPTTVKPTTVENQTSATPICEPGIFGNIAHPTECNRFYLCQGGVAIKLSCSSGYEFSSVTETCVFIVEGGCTLGPSTDTPKTTDYSTTEDFTNEIKTTPHSGQTEETYTPTIENTEITNPTADSIEITRTTNQQDVETTSDVTPTTLKPKPICPPGVFGNVPHPEKCTAFYMCQGGIAIELNCPTGNEFSSESKSCVRISDNGCTASKS